MKRIARAEALYHGSIGQAVQGLHEATCPARNTSSTWAASGRFSATHGLILHGLLLLRQTHSSGVFGGLAAALVSDMVRCWFCNIVGNKGDLKPCKLKTAFLRSFLVIGAKPKRL
jgi:hypothetical protein